MEEVNPAKNRKRPRKKNFSRFRAKVKRYSKSGRYGRGSQIDDNDFNYFINILDTMKDGFENTEEKELMTRNVLEQTENREVELASNQIVSKVLEALIAFANEMRLERYLSAFGEDLRPVCADPFASHVLQKLLQVAFLRAVGKENEKLSSHTKPEQQQQTSSGLLEEVTYNLETDFKTEHRQKCSAFVERIGKFMLNNMEDFVWDTFANHIIRTCILCLAGIHIPKVAFEKSSKDTCKYHKLFIVAPQWHQIMKEYAERLEMWPQFSDMPFEEKTSALLNIVLSGLYEVDKKALKRMGRKLLIESFVKPNSFEGQKDEKIISSGKDKEKEITALEYSNMPKVFDSQPALILLETLLTLAGPKLFTQIYVMLFAGRVDKLAVERSTNFAVQKLLNNIRQKEDFEKIFEDLIPKMETLLQIGNTGLVAAISDACLRLSIKQSAFVSALQKALHIQGKNEHIKDYLQCLVKLKPYEVAYADTSTFVHLHGSLIVQNILHFNKPIFLVNSILDTPSDKLCMLFNNPNGSHIVNAFLESKYVGEKSREKLIRHLENFYLDLATTKFGSRVIECLFAAAQDAQKSRIVKALSEKENLLMSTQFGRILGSKLMLRTYRLSPAQWKVSYQKHKEDKAKYLFKDIIT